MNNWEFIEKLIYINLEDRKDRRETIQEVLKVIPQEKIIRFNAIKEKNGHIGASKSHIECIKMAIKNNWKNVMIIEDDMSWKKYEDGYKILEKLISNPYDAIVLGGIRVHLDTKTYKLHECHSMTAYIVSNHYYQTILENFEVGLENLIKTPEKHLNYCIDQYWKKLHKKDNWFIVNPALCIQGKNFSSILNTMVDTTNYFN